MRRTISLILIFILAQAGAPYHAWPDGVAYNIIQKRSVSPDNPLPEAVPLTLSDCYGLSLKQSEKIAIDAEQIKIAEARFLQALSIMLPNVSFVSKDIQQGSPDGAFTDVSGALVSTAKDSQRQFTVTQTLFNGFKAFAGITGSKLERNQYINQKIRAEQLLLVDVSNAFYLLMEKREDLRALQKIRIALSNRIKELRQRERLGRSRPSEVVNAKAQLYGVESDIEISKNQEVIARLLLEFLVGGSVYSISDTHDMPSDLQPVNYYVAKSDQRPDVKATRFGWEVAKKEVMIVNSDFLPNVDVEANYYTQRTGSSKGIDWDVTLNVNVPIFDGALTIGRSNEAIAKARQEELAYKRTKRLAPYDIRDSYVRLSTAMSVHKLLEKEYKTAKLNYHLQRKDYQLSLVNNLDVLTSIQTLQNAQRDSIHALYEAKREYWQLRVAVGEGITETLNDAF
ncbi:MAG: TolC family protein [Candidatus Omnitrophota bacterium]